MAAKRDETRLIVPLTSPDVASMRTGMVRAAEMGADAVECRLDFLAAETTDEDLARLLADAPVEVIVTCRPRRQGGRYAGKESGRLDILRRAAKGQPAFVDVEMDTPMEARPEAATILSHHDYHACPADLEAIAARLDASDAAVNKVVFNAAGPDEALRAFDVLRACRKPTLALAMGQAGLMTRILAGKFGAFGTFASLARGAESAPGQPTMQELCDLYRWKSITPNTAVFGVIGCPVAHSMSPAIHNAALAATRTNGVYVPVLIQPGMENFSRFMDALLARPWMNWRGLSVTIPHKENALAYLGAKNCDPLAVTIGAVNTVTIQPDGALRGDNTDYSAAMDSLCEAMGIRRDQLAGRTVAVIGAGGVARAIVAALRHRQADVTLYNRTFSRAEQIGREFNCRPAPLAEAPGSEAEIIVNCTSLGMHPNVDASPLREIPAAARVVFDTIYNPLETQLGRLAKAAGCLFVSGAEMFVNQAVAQFHTWTGRPAPRDVMKRILVEQLDSNT